MRKLRAFELSALRFNHQPLEQDDHNKTETDPKEQSPAGRFGGWKGTLLLGSITTVIVFILNLVMVLWATLHHSDAKSVLYSGHCDRVKNISAGVHFLINILSTLLLSASNFAMQCLSAPTREDLDRAHSQPKSRSLLWLCLVFSSIPLHLFYNSTVYATVSANAYDVYVADSSSMPLPTNHSISVYDEVSDLIWNPSSIQRLASRADDYQRLTPEECIDAYATSFQSKYGSVILISEAFTGVNTSLNRIYGQEVPSSSDDIDIDPYRWICAERGDTILDHACSYYLSDIRSRGNWTVRGYKVDYCLADNEGEKCTLEFSLTLAIAVIGTNFGKAALIVLVMVLANNAPLLTVGDAIASALRFPDEITKGSCLLSRDWVTSKSKQEKLSSFYSKVRKVTVFLVSAVRRVGIHGPESFDLGSYIAQPLKDSNDPVKYIAAPQRRWFALSNTRWVTCLFTYTSSLALCIGLLVRGVTQINDQAGIWTSGLASINTKTMIDSLGWPGGLIPNTLIANIPQVIFSLLYFMCSAILTNMALSSEWDRFAITRKGLRVSTPPQGHQRRTHFFSLPYRYSVPLIAISALLHWLMSQSIFLVRIVAYRNGERDTGGDTMTVGYSPPAIVIGVSVGILLPLGLVLTGLRQFRSGMPVAGSCSLAITAACHSHNADRLEMEYKRLKWGVVESSTDGDIGHCAFSDEKVDMPVDGRLYR
ncbi:hypothetical protein BJX64DRAFT_276406 [Aspergillus heterothallicus]